MQPVLLKPEIASLTVGTCNFGPDVFMNTEEYIETFAKVMLENGVKPELEIFDRGMIFNALKLQKKGLVKCNIFFFWITTYSRPRASTE